jgi:hypothetical protein
LASAFFAKLIFRDFLFDLENVPAHDGFRCDNDQEHFQLGTTTKTTAKKMTMMTAKTTTASPLPIPFAVTYLGTEASSVTRPISRRANLRRPRPLWETRAAANV